MKVLDIVTVTLVIFTVIGLFIKGNSIFTARCYASTHVYFAKNIGNSIFTVRCHGPVSVRPSVCLSQVGVLLKWLSIGSHKQHHTIAQGL